MKTITFPRGPIFGADGKISPNGILLGYEPETDNLKQWFYDDEHTTLAPNPIQAASDGRIPEVYLGEGKYRIRQYAPASEQAIIPDDMTDFPVGDDWTFICEWYCEGETIVKGTKTLTVDFVSELAGISGADAAWVQVMNYSHTGDCFPRWFYYTNVAHTDDGGSVFVAQDGGYWVLAMDGQFVDARIFGVLETDADVFSNLEKALAYCHDKDKALFLPAGTYTLATTGTLHAQCPILFGSNVLFNTEDGASVVFSVEGEYEIPQTSTMCYDASADFHMDFTNCPIVGTAYPCWNALDGGDYDISRFEGQNIVLNVAGGHYSSGADGCHIPRVSVAADCQLANDYHDDPMEIGTLVSAGGKVSTGARVNIWIDKAYASALASGNDTLAFNISTLVLDTNLTYNSTIDLPVGVTFDRIEEAGGKLVLTADYMATPPTLTVNELNTLRLTVFALPITSNKLDAVAQNNNGVVDLLGRSWNISEIPSSVSQIKEGDISSSSVYANDSVSLDRVSVGTSWYQASGDLLLHHCVMNGSAGTIVLSEGVDLLATDTTFSLPITASAGNDPQAVDHVIECRDCYFASSTGSSFANSNLVLTDCTFSKQFTLNYPKDTRITGCTSTDDSAADNLAFKITGINYTGFRCHIVGNFPNPEDDTAGLHWPSSEGQFYHKVVATDLDMSQPPFNTKWGMLSEAVDPTDPNVGPSIKFATCERVAHDGSFAAPIFLSVPRHAVLNTNASVNFWLARNGEMAQPAGETNFYGQNYGVVYNGDYSLVVDDIVRIWFKCNSAY